MRRFVFALSLVWLPVLQAAQEPAHKAHVSTAAHEHGRASLNLALEGSVLDIELESPAMNLLGFEREPRTAEDKARVEVVRKALAEPLRLFSPADAAQCSLKAKTLEANLLEHEHEHEHDKAEAEHHDIHASYQFSCARPEHLGRLDLSGFFRQFPATQVISVQLIGPHGQRGIQASAAQALLDF